MTHDGKDVLIRFFRALVREINQGNPETLTTPFSVAEIYQNLVPYRTHRDEIGVEMNGDYEHALLRLLAGEGDFLTIESRTARQEIREELESPNPNTALYRDFAAADVLLNPDKVDEILANLELAEALGDQEDGEADQPDPPLVVESVDEAPETFFESDETAEEPADAAEEEQAELAPDTPEQSGEPDEETTSPEEGAPTGADWKDPSTWMEPSLEDLKRQYEENRKERMTQDGADDLPATGEVASEALPFEVSVESGSSNEAEDISEAPEPAGEDEAVESQEFEVPENCAWCREKLPERPGVNFCPFCGMSVKLVPCPECGEELELNWRFCIACGTEVSS